MNKVIILFSLSNIALAAGGGSGGSPWDLKFAAVNALIFFGFLGFVLSKALKTLFSKMSVDVSNLLQEASVKDKEASIKLKTYKDKLDHFDDEASKIERDGIEQTALFKQKIEAETKDAIERFRKDSQARLDGEIQSVQNELNRELVDKIISNVKSKVAGDKTMAGKVTQGLIKSIK